MYFELPNIVEVSIANELTIPRARELHEAILHGRDYTLIQILRCEVDGSTAQECFVIEIECDGVPPRNSVGIHYRERLALCVPRDAKRLVEVFALRKDFPVLIHQNQVSPDAPANLCLYFELPTAVFRNWTPQNFFRRIQWWLEKSSRGELHPSNLPVEQLFFSSPAENQGANAAYPMGLVNGSACFDLPQHGEKFRRGYFTNRPVAK